MMNLLNTYTFSLFVLILVSGCGETSASSADVSQNPDASNSVADSGSLLRYPTVSDFPECDAKEPSVACIRKLFLPVRTTSLPFDGNIIADARSGPAFYVGSDWQMTVLHGIEATSLFPTRCYVGEYWFSPDKIETINIDGCGEFLFVGGHPRSLQCQDEGVLVGNCVDQVPVAEAFDIGLKRAEQTGANVLSVSDTGPSIGDQVFVVGRPYFHWLTQEERDSLEDIYPAVSFGKVIAVEGHGIVTDNLVFPGNSGGPILNVSGQAIGILYTKIADVRGQGTDTDQAWLDRYSVSVRIGEPMVDIIKTLAQP